MALAAALALGTGSAAAFDIPAKPAARVDDFAGVLDPSSKAAIERRLAEFEQASTTQIVVAIIPALGDDSIEDLAVKIVETWGIGQKGTNNGVLLLVAMQERKARIEVGYGLEDRLTDALSRGILEDRLFPAFRSGRYGEGILATCDAIIDATRGAYTAPQHRRRKTSGFIPLIPIAIIVLFILIGLQRGGGITGGGRRRYYRSGPIWWGGGGGGGWGGGSGGGGGFGGFSGGGGLSGGGGASGSW